VARALLSAADASRYSSLSSASRATLSSFFCSASIFGYFKSSSATVSTTAAATTSRVNHLLSAGTTNHGARFDAVLQALSLLSW
jgi:hypothetical protein